MPHGLIQSSVLCLITQADIGYWISDDIQDIALKGSLELTLKPFLSFPPHFLLWPLSYSLFLPTRTSSCFTKLEKEISHFQVDRQDLLVHTLSLPSAFMMEMEVIQSSLTAQN